MNSANLDLLNCQKLRIYGYDWVSLKVFSVVFFSRNFVNIGENYLFYDFKTA